MFAIYSYIFVPLHKFYSAWLSSLFFDIHRNGSNNPNHGIDDGLGGGFDGDHNPGPRNGSGPTPGRGRGGYAPVPTDPVKPVGV